MSDRTNRRDAIIDAAARLFVEHGYTATSVRQIAEAVGVTEAALYYHFKEGKRALLQAVVEEHLPDMLNALEDAKQAESLYDLVLRFGHGLARLARTTRHVQKLRWVSSEFPKLNPEERDLVRQKQIEFHKQLREQVRRFVDDDRTAETVAWTMMSTVFGYAQLFINLDLQAVTDFSPELLAELLAGMLACCYEEPHE